MNDLIIYHYPPELMSLLIDTIPLLQKSKIDVVTFFRGAGVSELLLTDIRQQLTRDSSTINKYEITRRVLKNINEGADKTIKARREILKRVVEFENFDSCWPDDRLKAKGLVASIRELINVKDTFTKINNELDRTRVERIRLQKEKDDKLNNYRQESECLKNDFFALFSLNDPYKRGKTLETVINRLFQHYNILIREAFVVVSQEGEGIIEQIDGVISIDGMLYLVEIKWWKDPVGRPEVSEHLVRLFTRDGVGGIFISASDYTKAAVTTCKEVLAQRTITLCTLHEVVNILQEGGNLLEFLRKKLEIARIEKNPYGNPLGI